MLEFHQFRAVAISCHNSPVGKRLPSALYVHSSALSALAPLLQQYERQARNIAQQDIKQLGAATLVKFSTEQPKVSYLFYPDFDTEPHPELQASVIVYLEARSVSYRDYSGSDNSPILHRKETFVAPTYPHYEEFAQLTRVEAALGLLDNSRQIGTSQEWNQLLADYELTFVGHRLVCPLGRAHQPVRIDRHKAAIVRKALSRPVRLALEAELLTPDTRFFDYGCGYGGDVERVAEQGYPSSGWDPYYRPHSPCTAADIVNLGYIINVIEDPVERREALVRAWKLTSRVLIVAAQVLIDDRHRGLVAYGDGIITGRNTFQKYYEQEELKTYIDQVLNVDAVPVGLGVYFVFRDELQAQTFRASRFRSRTTTPTIRTPVKRFEDYQELLAPLMAFMTQRGRLPTTGELPEEAEIRAEFGTLRRAFKVILQATNESEWEAIAELRRQELKLYLALGKFSGRPKPRSLPPVLREDLKALLGNYRQACLLADMMLFSVGDLDNVAEVAHASIGKRGRYSLTVHISALPVLDPLLRLYEGCASRTIGRLEEANVVKFHLRQPRISYLFYPNFDSDPHPVLQTSMDVNLHNLQVHYRDYDPNNPPILHQKDALVTQNYPHYERFAKLTRQEQDWGLLDDLNAISHRQGWLRCLAAHCAQLQGHQLRWCKEADPYRVKLLRSQIQARRRIRQAGRMQG
ncbi:MAG: DNA phosphorothioation-associated putative methyltransferase [Cyanophyceae cyanobacterium]